MRQFLVSVAMAVGVVLLVGFLSTCGFIQTDNDAVTNLVRAVLILALMVGAWGLLRPLIIRWLRALLRDLRDEDDEGK